MTRDYSTFLPEKTTIAGAEMRRSIITSLGWRPFFAQQVSTDELTETPPVRIVEVHRKALHVVGDRIDTSIRPLPNVTVGDWIMLNQDDTLLSRVLDRLSLMKRRAPGSNLQIQLIASNIDTAFIVSSCNPDFNVARLERYISLAMEADTAPVIVLTKTDLATDPEDYIAQARAISDVVPVIALDARGDAPREQLAQWCKPGQTVAFFGTSGVGKSTLTNALAGSDAIETQEIREDDARGRHTTTRRQLYIVPNGCMVLDTPGMRELQMMDSASGIDDLFSNLHALSAQCKFNDCKHTVEPGCAVRAAIDDGTVEEARYTRWLKLKSEDAENTATMAMRKAKDKVLGKTIRKIQKKNKKSG